MVTHYFNHSIYLNKDQRYQLHDGHAIETIGSYFMAEINNDHSIESAKEIFCKYLLKNEKINLPIKALEDGFEIILPNREGKSLNISNEKWLNLKISKPHVLELMYQKTIAEISSKNLLDIKDGGSGSLFYKEKNKTTINGQQIDAFHYILISNIEELEDSLLVL